MHLLPKLRKLRVAPAVAHPPFEDALKLERQKCAEQRPALVEKASAHRVAFTIFLQTG